LKTAVECRIARLQIKQEDGIREIPVDGIEQGGEGSEPRRRRPRAGREQHELGLQRLEVDGPNLLVEQLHRYVERARRRIVARKLRVLRPDLHMPRARP
jgi:hypothetical protein